MADKICGCLVIYELSTRVAVSWLLKFITLTVAYCKKNALPYTQWSNCKIGRSGTPSRAQEREPIMGAGAPPHRRPAPGQGVRGRSSLKLKTILLLDSRQTYRACRSFSISQRRSVCMVQFQFLGARRSPSKSGRGTPFPRVPSQFDHWPYNFIHHTNYVTWDHTTVPVKWHLIPSNASVLHQRAVKTVQRTLLHNRCLAKNLLLTN